MKKRVLLFIVLLVSLGGFGCTPANNNEKAEYEIKAITTDVLYPGLVTCPRLVGNDDFIEQVNSLILQSVNSELNEILEDSLPNVILDIGYSVSFQSEELICFLFEGTLNDENAAHPSNVAFSISISLTDKKLINISSLFEMNETFVQAFRAQLNTVADHDRFSENDWEKVSSYIENFSDEEIMNILLKEPEKTLAIQDGGIIVLFPVPHAIGDYVKIIVPKTGDGSLS